MFSGTPVSTVFIDLFTQVKRSTLNNPSNSILLDSLYNLARQENPTVQAKSSTFPLLRSFVVINRIVVSSPEALDQLYTLLRTAPGTLHSHLIGVKDDIDSIYSEVNGVSSSMTSFASQNSQSKNSGETETYKKAVIPDLTNKLAQALEQNNYIAANIIFNKILKFYSKNTFIPAVDSAYDEFMEKTKYFANTVQLAIQSHLEADDIDFELLKQQIEFTNNIWNFISESELDPFFRNSLEEIGKAISRRNKVTLEIDYLVFSLDLMHEHYLENDKDLMQVSEKVRVSIEKLKKCLQENSEEIGKIKCAAMNLLSFIFTYPDIDPNNELQDNLHKHVIMQLIRTQEISLFEFLDLLQKSETKELPMYGFYYSTLSQNVILDILQNSLVAVLASLRTPATDQIDGNKVLQDLHKWAKNFDKYLVWFDERTNDKQFESRNFLMAALLKSILADPFIQHHPDVAKLTDDLTSCVMVLESNVDEEEQVMSDSSENEESDKVSEDENSVNTHKRSTSSSAKLFDRANSKRAKKENHDNELSEDEEIKPPMKGI